MGEARVITLDLTLVPTLPLTRQEGNHKILTVVLLEAYQAQYEVLAEA